jgi:hypothetical protein
MQLDRRFEQGLSLICRAFEPRSPKYLSFYTILTMRKIYYSLLQAIKNTLQ